jgi:hypothetical protein
LRLQSLRTFLTFRGLRIVPALAVEPPLLSTLPLKEYFASPTLLEYFGSLIGRVRFELPGVFETNPYPLRVNSNLWTIPPGIFCYLFIACMIVMVAYKSRIAMLSAAVVLIGVNLYKDHVEGWWVSEGLVSVRHLVLCFVFGTVLYQWRAFVPYRLSLFAFCAAVTFFTIRSPGVIYMGLLATTYCTGAIGMMPLRPPARETRMQRALEAPLAEVRAEISQHFAAQERKAVGLVWAQLRTDQPEPSPSDDVMVMVRTVTEGARSARPNVCNRRNRRCGRQ